MLGLIDHGKGVEISPDVAHHDAWLHLPTLAEPAVQC